MVSRILIRKGCKQKEGYACSISLEALRRWAAIFLLEVKIDRHCASAHFFGSKKSGRQSNASCVSGSSRILPPAECMKSALPRHR